MVYNFLNFFFILFTLSFTFFLYVVKILITQFVKIPKNKNKFKFKNKQCRKYKNKTKHKMRFFSLWIHRITDRHRTIFLLLSLNLNRWSDFCIRLFCFSNWKQVQLWKRKTLKKRKTTVENYVSYYWNIFLKNK
jgi:hypothetical protein